MKKLIAVFMTALMAVFPIVTAAELGNYPAFLAEDDGTLDVVIAVGKDAKVADVIGAVNVASRLAEVGETTASVECAGSDAAVNGIRKDTIDLPTSATGTGLGHSSAFPASGLLKTFHYSGLKDSVISWKSDEYDFHEEVSLAAAEFRHDFTDSKINGTETLVIASGDIWYKYVFDEALNLSSASSAGTIASPDYTYPINVMLLGKAFSIVGLGTNQMKMLSGTVGTATATTPVVHGDYSVYADLGSDASWSRVIIKDADDNTVDTLTVTSGSSKDSAATGLTVQVTAVRALQDGTVVGADVVVGPTTDGTTKTYDSSADVTSTGSTSDRFPGETEWGIEVSVAASTAEITANDYIKIVYKPTSKQYIKAGEKLALPNNYGDLGFEGWNTDLFKTVTVEIVSGISGTDKDSDTTTYGNLNGVKISPSDASGSIKSSTGNSYSAAYILFNASRAAGGDSAPVMLGYYDSSKKKILVDPDAAVTDEYAAEIMTWASNETMTNYGFILNYGSVGEASFNVNFSVGTAENNTEILGLFKIGTKIEVDFTNATPWTASDAPTFRLGTTDSAQATDVVVTSGGASQNAGLKTQEIIVDDGILLQAPESNAASNKVVVKIPSKALKIKAYFGKVGEGVSGNAVTYTSYPNVPITSSVAKLDDELTTADKGKNIISLGGSAVNRVTALAMGLDYPTYGAASGISEDKGLVKVVDSPYTEGTGKVVVVVAGWEADNTRAAAAVLQQYDTKLSGITGAEVEVSGTVGAPVVSEVTMEAEAEAEAEE